ncbi:hypothetical protein QFZ22_009626 [Streptomyces canus]|uniref:Uncharacterized protein n=1 Tax=Streptomyces canus TaxID=58343 RepID=A0AAW8FUN1_9ACTN|nr:hypothetical protein [Streptomyces canus]
MALSQPDLLRLLEDYYAAPRTLVEDLPPATLSVGLRGVDEGHQAARSGAVRGCPGSGAADGAQGDCTSGTYVATSPTAESGRQADRCRGAVRGDPHREVHREG